MKHSKRFLQILPIGLFAVLLISLSSCSKQEFDGTVASEQDQLINRTKNLRLNLKTSDGKVHLKTSANGNLSFSTGSSASGSTNFTTGENTTTYSNGESGLTMATTTEGQSFSNPTTGNSFGASGLFTSGGGQVSIDGKTFNMDYVFCAADSNLFGDFSEFPLDKIQLLIGISGEFENPETAQFESLVIAYVIGDDASGNYTINIEAFEDEDFNGKFALVAVYDFSNVDMAEGMNIDDAKIYLSTKGTLQAAGSAFLYNNMEFLEILLSGELGNKKVNGSGNLFCN